MIATGRTDNQCKNLWYSSLRKRMRQNGKKGNNQDLQSGEQQPVKRSKTTIESSPVPRPSAHSCSPCRPGPTSSACESITNIVGSRSCRTYTHKQKSAEGGQEQAQQEDQEPQPGSLAAVLLEVHKLHAQRKHSLIYILTNK